MQNPKFSVVMPCFLNRDEHKPVIEDCIASVKEYSQDYEFIIVDDGSTLPTGFLKEAADTYIRHNPQNKGIASSWNDGIKIARGKYIVVINDDIRVKQGWLEGLAKAFEYEKTGVSAPAVEHIPHRAEGVQEDWNWYPGYCFMLSREVIKEMENKEAKLEEPCPGYFDENFVPFNCEDCDYWERVRKAGYKMMRVWDVEIWHAEGDTIHHMDYVKQSEDAINRFINKHKFDPRIEYYK